MFAKYPNINTLEIIEYFNPQNLTDIRIAPSNDWNFKAAKRDMYTQDFLGYALWLLDDITMQEIEMLTPIVGFWASSPEGWRRIEIAELLSSLLTDDKRKSRINSAIEKCECFGAKGFPTLHLKHTRLAVGAVICELLAAGLECKLSGLMMDRAEFLAKLSAKRGALKAAAR